MSKELENSINIYDKALESVMKHHEVTDMSLEIEALERAKKVEELRELYKKSHDCIVCCPHQDTFHCVVRYTDDEEFNRLLNEIKALEEELK